MKYIELNGKYGDGKFAIVDDDIYHKYKNHKMHCSPRGYVIFGHNKVLHREIMTPPKGMVVDHKNHNKLDNRRCNLRVCTYSDNNKNRKCKNYFWDNTHKYWVVTMRKNGKCHSRIYHSEEEAKKIAKEWSSGKIPENRRPRKKWQYPSNVWRNRRSGYKVAFQHKGVRYVKYGFKTVADAVKYRDEMFLKIGRTADV